MKKENHLLNFHFGVKSQIYPVTFHFNEAPFHFSQPDLGGSNGALSSDQKLWFLRLQRHIEDYLSVIVILHNKGLLMTCHIVSRLKTICNMY